MEGHSLHIANILSVRATKGAARKVENGKSHVYICAPRSNFLGLVVVHAEKALAVQLRFCLSEAKVCTFWTESESALPCGPAWKKLTQAVKREVLFFGHALHQ